MPPAVPDSVQAGNMLRLLCISTRITRHVPAAIILLSSCRELTGLRIDSHHIRALPPLPAQLQHLRVSGCRNLRSLPALPGTLQTLYCDHCVALQALPDSLASTVVTELNCSNCSCLTELPGLPESLQDLDVEDCTSLAAVSIAVRTHNATCMPHVVITIT
jgi:hypothetical protein